MRDLRVFAEDRLFHKADGVEKTHDVEGVTIRHFIRMYTEIMRRLNEKNHFCGVFVRFMRWA